MAGGLQGAMLIMAGGLNKIVARFGDVLGTNLYGYYGSFVVCVIAIAVVYALILPALLLVPKQLIDRRRPNARNRLNQPIITLLCRLRARLRAFRRRYLCANPAWCFENSTDSTEEDHSIVQYWFPPPCGAPSQNLYSSPTPRFPDAMLMINATAIKYAHIRKFCQ